MSDNITLPRATVEQALEALIENARLLGATQAKKGFGCYSQEDARLERAWHEGIAKHSAALRAALAQQAEPLSEDQEQRMLRLCPHYGPSPARNEWIAGYEAALAQQAEPVHPSGFAYRYPDGVRFNNGGEVNGCLPSEVIPYYLGKAPHQQQTEPVLQGPVAWRYWKQKWNCWEYSDTKLEFPAVPAGTKMEPLYLVSPEVKSERHPVGTVHNSVKGGVVWNRWPDEMEDGTHLYVNPPPCQTCEALARTVLMDQMGRA